LKFKKINLKSLFIKLSIFVVSLLLLLTLLELSLRLLGKKWQQGRPDYMSEETIAKHDKIVACFGDSYTVGGLGTKDLSYPGILNKMTASDKTAVLNLGICESNSSQVLEAIENYTAANNPEAIVLLVGAANKYNFYGMKRINFYQKLRIYKMYQIMKLSVENRFLKKQIVKSFSETPNTGYYLSNDIEKIFSDAMQIDKTHGTLHMANYYISRKNDRLPMQSSFVSAGNKKVKELIEDLSEQEKKKILVDIVHIYAFIGDKAKAEQYYRLAKKYNPEQAKEMFVFYCLDNADMNEKE
jgi:tetratricopeptide (TPR) repeat protein